MIPIQLRLDLHGLQPAWPDASGVPIDQFFPEEAANELASLESFNKHLYRPNTYLHKWWARRSGTTFRHILKQLVIEPDKRDFYAAEGLEGKIVLDPMMGGGTTLHEAIRMGANVIGVDIDPIPVLQARTSLNWIPVYQKVKNFESFFKALQDTLSPFYRTNCPFCQAPSEIQFVLHALRRKCDCRETLFVDDLILREGNDGSIVSLCGVCGVVHSSVTRHCGNGLIGETLLTRTHHVCQSCHSSFREIIEEPFSKRYRPVVVVGQCSEHGLFFRPLDEGDRKVLQCAEAMAQRLDLGDPAEFKIPSGPKSNDLHRRNIGSFLELFTPRQLIYLHTVGRLLDDFSPNDRLWLSLLISTSLEFNSLLCGYKGVSKRRPGAIRHVFSHHAYSFPYTALENNPIFKEKASGTLRRLFYDRMVRAGQWATVPIERRITNGKIIEVKIHGEVDSGEAVNSFEALLEGSRRYYVCQGDSRELNLPDEFVDYIVTDPPYYDSVQYSDLSNFFRVWLRLFLPHEANWSYNQQASAVFEGGSSRYNRYVDILSQIWKECARVLKKPSGRLIFTFHHWNPEAWSQLAISLKRTGFVLINRYVVSSENPVSVHIRNLKALKHDAILVLAPAVAGNDLRQWPRPSRIDATDSHGFCHSCGAALGWLLSSELKEEQIHIIWKRLLSGGANGETPS